MLKDLKKFILRGNVIDLAVAVVIGAAFTGVVNSLVKDLFTPIIAAIAGQPDFSSLSFTINDSQLNYGNFLNALFAFLTVALAMFFLVVQPINRLMNYTNRNKKAEPGEIECKQCLSKIPAKAKICKFCGSPVKK